MGSSDSDNGKKRIAILSVSCLVLVAMVVAVTVGVNQNDSETNTSQEYGELQQSRKEAIHSICQHTDFKEVCVTSLNAAPGNSSDPKDLIKATFKVAMNRMSEAAAKSHTLQELEKDPRTHLALESCKELMHSSIDDLTKSVNHLGDFDITKIDELLVNLKVWLSAAIDYQETCLDAFQNTTGDAGEKMKKALNSTSELTRNGLAMVSQISSVLSSLEIPSLFNRRLLSEEEENFAFEVEESKDGLPSWASAGQRRVLARDTGRGRRHPDLVVAQDGSGNFSTINEALLAIPKKKNETFVLYIKEGIYEESVMINRSMTHLMMVGDGATKTKITGNKNFIDGTPTFKTATVSVLGDYFVAKDIGFENTAGAIKHQAVALRVQADMSIFYNCQMDGHQDTLYVHTKRQFYRDCTISGTIDFVFGDASAVFQNCRFVVRKPLDNQQCIVTAQGRKDPREPTGIVFQGCAIVADRSYYPVMKTNPSYLGRPWKEYSRTIIMQTRIDQLIQPEGWLPWMGDFALNTSFYSEFQNTGLGSKMDKRVTWPAVKKLKPEEYLAFTPGVFIDGDMWIKPTHVPYSSGLMKMR